MTKEKGKRILVVADPHIHNYSAFDKDGSRLANCIRLIEEVIERARIERIDTIVCCGDFFDKPVMPAAVVNAAAKVINSLPEAVTFLTISGNHDMYTTPRFGEKKGTAVDYLAELCPRFKVFDDLSVQVSEDCVLFGIPYYDDAGEFSKALDSACDEARAMWATDIYKILVIHQTPVGLDNTMIQTDTDPNDPRYDQFDLVLCGHIHMRQFITPTFVVAGTPIHRSAEDAGQEKGYFIVETGRAVKGMPAKEVMHFVSTRGRYPEFKVINEGEETKVGATDFVIVKPQKVEFKTKAASAADFGAGVSPMDLVTAYWKEVGQGDEQLLKVGLKLLQA